jgi:hypothetical protein
MVLSLRWSLQLLLSCIAVHCTACISERADQAVQTINVLPALQVHIVDGRHPVLESLRGNMVPNDVHLAASGPRVQIITGPNMGGERCTTSQHVEDVTDCILQLTPELTCECLLCMQYGRPRLLMCLC